MFRKSCKILTSDQKVKALATYDKNSSSRTVGEAFCEGEDAAGGKQSKERLTVVLCVPLTKDEITET